MPTRGTAYQHLSYMKSRYQKLRAEGRCVDCKAKHAEKQARCAECRRCFNLKRQAA